MKGKNKPDLITWGCRVRKYWIANLFPVYNDQSQEWEWSQFPLFPDNGDYYGNLVSQLVKSKYDKNRMEAIINNYLDDPDNEEHNSEFKEMQNWRKECKKIARECVTKIKEIEDGENQLPV